MSLIFDLFRQSNGSQNSLNWAGTAASSGGTAALGWSAVNGLQEGETLTITTDGSNPFGAVGPQFVALLDPWKVAVGDFLHSHIDKGAGVTFVGADNEKLFDVVNIGRLGKAFPIGSNGTGINPTSTQRLRCTHPNSVKQFESCMSYWPEANQQNAIPMLADSPNNPVTWQMKPVWNMANSGTYNDDGTNYFIRRAIGTGFYNTPDPGYFLDSPAFSTNMVGQSQSFDNTVASRDPAKPYRLPYDEIYTIETFYDQGSQTTNPDGKVEVFETREGAVLTKSIISNKVLVDLTDGSVINPIGVSHFTYPGFIRGFSIPQNQNFYDAELYKTIGDGACCRVVLSNHSDYFQSNLRAFQIIDEADWTNNQITIPSLRTGVFQGNIEGLYFNIMGINNTQIGSIAL